MEKPMTLILSENAMHALNLYLKHDQIVFGLQKPHGNLKDVIKEGYAYLHDHGFMKENDLTEKGQEVGIYLKIMNQATHFVKFDQSMFALDGPLDPIMTVGYQLLEDGTYSFSYGARMGLVANIILASPHMKSLDDNDDLEETWQRVNLTQFTLKTAEAAGISFEVYKDYAIVEHSTFLEMDKLVQVNHLDESVRIINPLTGRQEITRILEVENDARSTVY